MRWQDSDRKRNVSIAGRPSATEPCPEQEALGFSSYHWQFINYILSIYISRRKLKIKQVRTGIHHPASRQCSGHKLGYICVHCNTEYSLKVCSIGKALETFPKLTNTQETTETQKGWVSCFLTTHSFIWMARTASGLLVFTSRVCPPLLPSTHPKNPL